MSPIGRFPSCKKPKNVLTQYPLCDGKQLINMTLSYWPQARVTRT